MSSRVFVSYVQENLEIVTRLVNELRSRSVNVWFDRDALPPGTFWRDEIRRAIKAHEYFLACFSAEYAARPRTYMNEELELAIEELRLRGTAPWFIPILLSGEIPDRAIGPGRTIADIQFLDFRHDRWSDAMERLVHAVSGDRSSRDSHDASSSTSLELSFSGKRQEATDLFELTPGLWRAELSHAGHGHFAAWLLNADGDRVALLANESAPFRASKLVTVERGGKFVLDVSANGSWNIALGRPARSATHTSLAGSYQAGTPLLPFRRGLHKFRLSHGGDGHFAVWIFDAVGQKVQLLANETGAFEGSKAVQLANGEYAFDISANGPWSINW